MTEKLNQEVKFIIKTWHIIVSIIGFAFVTGGAYYKVLETNERVDKLESWKETRINTDLDVREIKTKIDLLYQAIKDKQKD